MSEIIEKWTAQAKNELKFLIGLKQLMIKTGITYISVNEIGDHNRPEWELSFMGNGRDIEFIKNSGQFTMDDIDEKINYKQDYIKEMES